MSHTTTKWGLIVPDETDTDDVPSWLDQLATKIDATITGWKADTWANRPTGGGVIDGLIFWATDQGLFYLCQGGALHQINPSAGLVGDIASSNFADAAAAGATGRFADAAHRHAREANPLTAHLAAGDPHSQYALDTDLTPINTNVTNLQNTQTELRLIQLMRPGQACPSMRRTAPITLAVGNNTLLTVAAGRKYVIKDIVIEANSSAAASTQDISLAGVYLTRQYQIGAGGSLVASMAKVLNAGETVVINSSVGGGVQATVYYVDLAAAEPCYSLWVQNGGLVAVTATDLFVAAANFVVTSVLFGNITTGTTTFGKFRADSAAQWDLSDVNVPPGTFAHSDSPIYVANGAHVQALDNAGGTLSLFVSGYTAQT